MSAWVVDAAGAAGGAREPSGVAVGVESDGLARIIGGGARAANDSDSKKASVGCKKVVGKP